MAPRTQGTNKNTPKRITTRHHSSEIATPSAAIDYGAVQKDEIEALQAIFMDDFEDIQVEGAWNKTSDHKFKLRIASFDDSQSFVVLTVRLTATYPKTVPIIEVDGLDKFHERTQQRVSVILHNRPKQLLGEVMIHAIATEIQDALEDAVQARQQGTLPSLIEERASAEEVATALAKQAEDAEAVRQKELHEEEEKALTRLVEQELNRREKRKTGRSTDQLGEQPSSTTNETISFEEAAEIVVGQEITTFQTVLIVSKDGNDMIAKPQLAAPHQSGLVKIRRCVIKSDRARIIELETTLKQVRNLHHNSITTLYQFRFDKHGENMSLTLCTELNPRGSLQDFLSIAGSIQISKARQFAIDLLEALEEYHRHGITHGSITCNNIDIAGSTTMILKLTDGGFARYLNPDVLLPKKWLPPEDATINSISLAKKADIWSLGVAIIQMSLGLDAISQYSSPQALFGKAILSDGFEDFVSRMCHVDNKKRPSAFDLLAVEFLRTNEPALADNGIEDKHLMKISSRSPIRSRSRHGSIMAPELPSRYAQDFTEIGRLGKGGFGEVVKARNKLDGGIYAIKKIVRAPQLDQILSEVMLLNRLNHPYVVRYYSTWVEETLQTNTDESSSITETITEDQELDFGLPSTGGLDFVSSSGYPLIEFGVDSDSDDSSVSSNEEQPLNGERSQLRSSDGQSVMRLRKMRSASRKMQSTLYIQMEFCERRTTRDLIRKGLDEDSCWRFIRQITEGLAHVHSHGIIHRDLKPDNIFMDVAGNPKIGDFGLATTQQYHISDRSQTLSSNASVDMTMSIGTAMYIAPELGASHGSSYNEKVDMYSLGIIFYEMCEPFATAMERIKALQEIRKKDHTLPEQYQPPNGLKSMQGKVISCLIAHKPSERPTSLELLRTGLLPVKIEDETIRQALSSLADPRSPNHQKMMSALFAHDQAAENQVKAMAWDAKDQTSFDEPLKLRMKAIARDALISTFKLHGAEEVYRDHIFPRSTYYTATNVFQLLDASGNLLQLPYDLTFPLARKLAHSHQTTRCTYTFGQVFRDTFAGGPPTTNEEVDFDIVTDSRGSDLSFDDAEVLKALDDIVTDPALMLNVDATCFHINHTAVLDAILSYCRIPLPQYAAVKECISKLGFRQFTWVKIRNELRSHAIGLSITAVDDLEQFDFRDVPEKALSRIREIIQTSEVPQSFDDGVNHLLSLVRHAQNLKLSRKIWLAPLSCFNAKFYDDGILLQCVHQRKTSRDVLAAGGRYTSLVKACGRANASDQSQGVVGMSIGFDRLVAHMLKQAKVESKSAFVKDKSDELTLQKRCEVCLRIGLGDAVKDAGIGLLASLWQGNISAELVREDHVASMHEHIFNVILRHEASTTVKVRNLENESPEVDIPISSLIAHLHQELRERQVSKRRQPILGRQRSQNTIERRGNVQVLMSQHRSKKSNKYTIVEAAQQRWAEKLDRWKDAPILAIETRDDVIELLRDTRLNDGESWKKALHTVPPNERQYLQQVQELLISWRKRWQEEDQMREACIFNFRTGHGIYYDLGL